MRVSTQELDDVLAAHRPCNCDPKIHCLTCDVDKFTPWPCLDYRLARDLKAALKVVEAGRPIVRAVFDPDGFVAFPLSQDLAAALAAYDTEETQ